MKTLLCILLALMTLCPLPSLAGSADDGVMREGLTALELTRLMGNGTNLGNTFEACDNKRGNFSSDPKAYETYWGQPVTTQAMLTAMKAAGFDTIRIPVAWMTNATNLAEGDYTISPAYLARIKEVVDYARHADMYVILNDHWDGPHLEGDEGVPLATTWPSNKCQLYQTLSGRQIHVTPGVLG